MLDSKVDAGLAKAVDFIHSVLNEESDIIIDESESEEMNKIILKNSITPDSFKVFDPGTFEESQPDYKLTAVDGGSQRVLNGGSFILGAYRAGYLIFKNGRIIESNNNINSIKTEFISFSNLRDIYSKAFTKLIGEAPVEYPRQLYVVLERLRTFAEWERVRELVEILDEGDIILIDGSLKPSINRLDILFQNILEKVTAKGIHLIGISKRSTLRLNHMPLIPRVKSMGEKKFSNKHWYCRISEAEPDRSTLEGDTSDSDTRQQFGQRYIVKFHPLSRFVFRTDVNILDNVNPQDLFRKISIYCNDPAYLGYPYPLADIHNQVVIRNAMREDLVYRLQGTALEKGINLGAWEDMFMDFHKVLDMNV